MKDIYASGEREQVLNGKGGGFRVDVRQVGGSE